MTPPAKRDRSRPDECDPVPTREGQGDPGAAPCPEGYPEEQPSDEPQRRQVEGQEPPERV